MLAVWTVVLNGRGTQDFRLGIYNWGDLCVLSEASVLVEGVPGCGKSGVVCSGGQPSIGAAIEINIISITVCIVLYMNSEL